MHSTRKLNTLSTAIVLGSTLGVLGSVGNQDPDASASAARLGLFKGHRAATSAFVHATLGLHKKIAWQPA